MKQPARFLFSMGLTTLVVATWSANSCAAESDASTQVLVQEDVPDQVTTAHWTRLPDAYVLRVVIDRPANPPRSASASTTASASTSANTDQPAAATNVTPYVPSLIGGDASAARGDRATFFIGNTIANLRGLDPAFGCRTLTLVDGRRVAGSGGQPAAAPLPAPPRPAPAAPQTMNQPYPPKLKDPRVEVWLLKADGTQILPATYSCDLTRPGTDKTRPHAEISWEFPLASVDQAVAAAIRVEDRYFIQKLQPAPR